MNGYPLTRKRTEGIIHLMFEATNSKEIGFFF